MPSITTPCHLSQDNDGSGKAAYVEFESLLRVNMHVSKQELPTRQVTNPNPYSNPDPDPSSSPSPAPAPALALALALTPIPSPSPSPNPIPNPDQAARAERDLCIADLSAVLEATPASEP